MKVVFLGRRQARWLCDTFSNAGGADARWLDSSVNLQPHHEAMLAGADKLVLQTTGAPTAPDFDALAPKADRILFPELALDFLWPFGGQTHARNTRDAFFPNGPFPVELGDAYLNRRLDGRQLAEAIEAEYLALDVAAILDLDAYKMLALERQAQLDALCGEDFASRFEAEFRARPLFSNPLAPAPDIWRELANRTFAKLGAPFALGEDWRPRRPIPELPVHPSVARHFGLKWTEGRRYRTWAGDSIDFEEYVRRYLAYAEGPELEAGVKMVCDGWATEGVNLLQVAVVRPMGRRSQSARAALAAGLAASQKLSAAEAAVDAASMAAQETTLLSQAAAFSALSQWKEAEAAAVAHIEKTPGSPEALAFLAQIREKMGDAEGRVAALRSALAIRPGDVSLQGQLTLALAAKGDIAGAIASAEIEASLNPENPHAHAFLAHLFERNGERERAQAEIARALEIISVGPQYAEARNALAKRQADLENAPFA